MSNLPVSNDIVEGSEFFSPLDRLDDLWPFYEEILHTSAPAHVMKDYNDDHHSQDLESQETAGTELDKGLKSMKISSKKIVIRKKKIDNASGEDEGPSSNLKKLDHNAKERIRRMKLNASYLALRALLPDSKRSKKRLGAPAIVSRVLKYIPEMENEIEELKTKKENMKAKNKKIISKNRNPSSSEYQRDLTISIDKVNEEEAIIQICMAKEDDHQEQAFTNLMQNMEENEGNICIKSASTNYVCETRICYHLHIQITQQTSSGTDYIEQLRDKVISWLR